MSKIDRAIEIVKSNPTSSRGDLIAKFMSDLGMSKAGATTYFYNATKGMERTAKTVSAVKAAKVLPIVKEPARPVATAAQIMKAAEKARKIKDDESAKIRQELEDFVNDIEGYTFPNGTLTPLRAPKVVDQDKLEEIKDKNLSVMKKVQKTFIQDVA
jgi:hypothetical protein